MSFEKTQNFDKYQEYKKIKTALSFQYKGVDIGKSIGWSLVGVVLDGFKPKLKDFIFLPFMRIDAGKFKKAFESAGVVFSTIYESRKDHTELLNKIQSSVSNSCIVLVAPHKKKYSINPGLVWLAAKHVFANAGLKKYPLKTKAHLICNILYTCNQVNELESTFEGISLKGKKYVPFVSAVGIEAVLTLFFNKKGADSFHIFHGLFGRYKIKIANDVINGENITAGKILAFGEATRQDMLNDFGYPSAMVAVAGNPKYPAREIKVTTSFTRCIVLNGFGFYDKTFVQLLPILNKVSEETGIIFDIKPHPNSQVTASPDYGLLNFIPKGETVVSLLQKGGYDFAITFNTVTYYECMYHQLVCLRYAENENLDFEGLNDRFTDKESLLEKINYFRNADSNKLSENIATLLKNTLGMGINNYETLVHNNQAFYF